MVKSLYALVAAACLVPFVATAQTTQTTQTTTTYENPEQLNARPGWSVGLFADTGVSSYTSSLANATQVGVAYGGRLDFSPIRNLGIEIGYDGSLNDLKTSISPNGSLYGNAVTGDLRFNLVPPGYDLPGNLKPFVFGGVGYQNVTPSNFTPGFSDANLLAVPVGGGIEADIADHFLVGARFTWNFLFNETGPLAGHTTDIWGATADLGARFY